MSLSEDLYKEIILEHSRSPSHRGHLDACSIKEEGVNRSCGDEVEIELLVEAGRIHQIRVNGHGCSISTASGSLLADAVEGRSIAEVHTIIQQFKQMIVDQVVVELPADLEDLEALRGVAKYPVRVKCATLSWNTLEQALLHLQEN
ncbi:MAG: SUF system NifU family Fe-S cluster assembly protein [Leptospiraceae bacterium]|nr:SUF system NifU family Fe-S cluster assembly protein [Leptospiraceae bacterium]